MAADTSTALATLIASVIAAFGGLLGIILNLRNATRLSRQGALRKLLESDINAVSACIYMLVAYSKKMATAKSDAAFRNFEKLAYDQRQTLTRLRPNVRYSLWGLDRGFVELRSTPMYLSHYKHSRSGAAARKIIWLSTQLRISLDKAIINAYSTGLPPSRWSRIRVWFWGWRLRVAFAKGRPGNRH